MLQFPEVWQSPWTLFVWPLPVSLSCFDDWLIVNVSPELPVWVAWPTPLWTKGTRPRRCFGALKTPSGPYCVCVSE